MSIRVTAAVAAFGVVNLVGSAHAETTINSPFEGVRHFTRTATVPRPLTVNVAEFDLNAPGLRFFVTPHNTSSSVNENVLRTTSSTVNVYGANVGINGSFYTYSDPNNVNEGNGTSGLINRGIVASQGDVYSPFEIDGRPWVTMNISADNQVNFAARDIPSRGSDGVRPINTDTNPQFDFYNALSGNIQLVTNGVNTSDDTSAIFGTPAPPRARTGVGVTADNKLMMITVDEGSNASRGATWFELAEIMRQYGVVNGMNIDGGGSSTMAFRQSGQSATVVNSLAVSERAVTTHLMAYANPTTTAIDTFVYADFLLGDEGTFGTALTFSGNTIGINANSSSTVVSTAALGDHGWVQELDIIDDTTVDDGWTVRHLANAGDYNTSEKRESAGWIGFWALTDTDDIDVLIALDESASATERSFRKTLIGDGEWHLYQWDLDDEASWNEWVGSSNGIIDSSVFALDSIQFFGADVDAVIQIDGVTHNALGRLIPEPASLALLVLPTLALSRRRRR